MEPKMLALVGAGGAIGAILRYLIGESMPDGFPWGTMTVNLLGSLILGVIVGMSLSPEMGLLFGTGVMGAFTTMSAYSVDLLQLLENSEYGPAATYLLVTILGCPMLAFGGMKIAQAS
ncbi:MAG: fluoride efflux transporter CrcB [Candidatus Thalassarchaeaceae archaeon]|jgi:CrcB protein|nr:fluoride efflux transporter CrcB [Candidatus Thalassarchaeaceae archaeon]